MDRDWGFGGSVEVMVRFMVEKNGGRCLYSGVQISDKCEKEEFPWSKSDVLLA